MPTTSAPADSTPTENTATPQSIEGEPAMTTTTTVTALHTGPESTPDEPSATENAQRAGTEQRETEHDDPADTGSARADTGLRTAAGHTGWCGWTPAGWPCTPHSLAASSGR